MPGLIQRAPAKLKQIKGDQKKLIEAAAKKNDLKPDQLFDFEFYTDRVSIILPSGQKLVYNYADLIGFFKAEEEAKPKPAPKPSPSPKSEGKGKGDEEAKPTRKSTRTRSRRSTNTRKK